MLYIGNQLIRIDQFNILFIIVSLLDSLDSTLNTTTSPKASIPGDKPREGGTGEHLGGADMLKTRTGTGWCYILINVPFLVSIHSLQLLKHSVMSHHFIR